MDLDDLFVYADGPVQQNEEAADHIGDDEQKVKPKKRRAAGRKRPKLTLEHLQKPTGLQDVFDNFPEWFQDGYRGKGHEVRDLRRLLELYQRWQPRVFPHGTYNQFESALEKLSGTHALKDALATFRQELRSRVDLQEQQDQQHDQDEEQQQQQQQQQWQEQPEEQGEGLHGYDDIDDEELLALQAKDAEMESAEEAVPEAFGDDFDDHDPARTAKTATAAAHMPHTRAGGSMQAAKRGMRDWSDDDDDDGRQEHSRLHRRQQQTETTPVTGGADGKRGTPAAAAAEDGDSDNDLLNDLLQDEELVQENVVDASGIASDEPADPDEKDVSRRPKRSRLQRTAALQDGSEDDDLADVQATPAAAGESEAASQQQQHRRQWQLANDDSDDDSSPGAGDRAGGAPQQIDGGAGQLAGTQDDDDEIQFAPLAPPMESVGCETVDEMQLLLGTDLDGQQHQEQKYR